MKTSLSQSDKVECSICNKKIMIGRMRQHIGYHIVKNDIIVDANLCGFCGNNGCNIMIKKTTVGYAKPFSTYCKLYRPFNLKSASKSSANSPCTRPIECLLCNGVYWSYNMESHYKANHNNNDLPIHITEEEINQVLLKCI